MADPIRDKALGWPWSTDNLSSHTATLVETGITLASLDGVHTVHKTTELLLCVCGMTQRDRDWLMYLCDKTLWYLKKQYLAKSPTLTDLAQ